jgi:FkbM family methyltransferase
MDPVVFNDMVTKNEYAVGQGDFACRNVLDIGANVGMFSMIAAAMGAKNIVAIEPNAGNFRKLVDNCRPYANIHPLHFAVHGKGQPTCRTLGEGTECTVELSPEGDVPVVTLSQATSLFPPLDNDLLLKMDIEGAEFDVFYCSEKDAVRRFETIMLEIHSRDDPQRSNLLEKFVSDMGYRTVSASPLFLFPQYVYLGQNVLKYERI